MTLNNNLIENFPNIIETEVPKISSDVLNNVPLESTRSIQIKSIRRSFPYPNREEEPSQLRRTQVATSTISYLQVHFELFTLRPRPRPRSTIATAAAEITSDGGIQQH
jgi:hypothetical protein